MPSIDERVVSMAFENQVFEQRVAVTMSTLSKLDTAVRNIGGTSGFDKIEAQASKVTLQSPMSALDKLKAKLGGASTGAAEGLGGIDRAGNKVTLEGPIRAIDKTQTKMNQLSADSTFTDIEKASGRVSLEGLTKALDNVTGKFSVLQGAASVALGGIVSQATMKGAGFAKSFAFGPAKQGFEEYQTNLGSIQTILANTQGQQVSGLKPVQRNLGELNKYSDKTIYNFSEMAKNIGTFTAAGVGLNESTKSIKGIANLAALSGSNSQQASTAMYQLSQAIASGRVGLQDWNSVVNAGMGGAVFQKSLMRTAVNMGAIDKGALKIDKTTGKATINGQSFRESIMAKPGEKSWLTSDVLTKTLGQLTGDMTDAQLAAQGFDAAQIKAIQAQAKSAQNAATQVKTLPQVFDVARETIGSGWSQTFQNIFGNFNESKKTFTELSNTINGFINTNSNARNKVLKVWHDLGGRTILLDGIKAAFQDIIAVLKPVKDAFRDIFPAKTGQDLIGMTKSFARLMEALKPSPATVDSLRRIFAGLFAVVHIGWTIIKQFVGVIFDLLGVIGKGSGGFLGFVAGIGDFLVAVDKALTKGGLLQGIFKGIGAVLTIPLRLLGAVAGAIAHLFGTDAAGKGKGFEDSLQGVNDKLGPLKKVIDTVVTAWKKLVDIVSTVKTALDPWFSDMAQKLSGVGDILANSLKGLNFEKIMQGLQVGFVGGIFVTLKKALGVGGVGKGILDGLTKPLQGVNDVLGGFTKQMEGMQSKLHAEALLAIAGAVAVLVASLFILSTIDGDKLSKALTATAIGLGELMGAMKLMTSGIGKTAVLQLPIIAAGMIGLAFATVILAGAMKIFATMSWGDIVKGLAGVAGSLAGVAISMKLMPSGPNMVIQAAGITLLAAAMNLMAFAVGTFAKLSWEELVRGLAGVTGSILGIGSAISLLPPTLPLTAVGLVILGVGLTAIAGAVRAFGGMDLFKMVQGLTGMMLAIAGIGLAVSFIPPTIALSAAGLLIVGQAMVVTAGAIALLGSLNLGTLVKGIIALAATLVVLALGLTLMIVALPGAAALLVAAAALAVLVPVLGILGTMKWSTIFKGLGAIAAVLLTIGVVGLIAAPALVALGIALIPLGLGFLLVATAVRVFAGGIALLSTAGQKGFAVFMTALTGFVALIPTLIISLVKGLLSIADQIVVLAPKIVIALGKILTTVIAFIITQAPKLALAIGAIITAVIQVVGDNAPKIQAAGFKLLQDLLTGMSQNIGALTNKAADIITKFLNVLASRTPALVAAGVRTLVAFLQGVTSKISTVVNTVANMVTKFIEALSRNVPKIIGAGQDLMIKLIGAIASFGPKLIAKGVDIIISFLNGINNAIPRIKNKALEVARTFLTNLADGLVKLVDIGFNAIIRFLNGLARTIRQNDQALINAGWNVASAIGQGMLRGLASIGPRIVSVIGNIIKALPRKALSILGIASPSKVFMDIGRFTTLGLARGLERGGSDVDKSITAVSNNAMRLAKNTLSSVPNLLDGMMDLDPVISPVLDLSNVEQEAAKLASLLPTSMITAAASFDQAAVISGQTATLAATAVAPTTAPTTVKFEQNNYSPDPLSNIEIYRQTNNQISRIKTLVGVP